MFSVSNDDNKWSFDFGGDSVILVLEDLVHGLAIRFQKKSLPAWSLLLSEIRDFLNIQVARFLYTTDQQRILQIWDEVISSVGAHDMDTFGHQVFDLEDIEILWKDLDLIKDAVVQPRIDTAFSSSTFNYFEMGSRIDNPTLIDKAYDNENLPPPATTPFSWRPSRPPALPRIELF